MQEERNELAEEVTEIIDHGDLQGNPILAGSKKAEILKGPTEIEAPAVPNLNLTDEEEEMLKDKLEQIRKADPFIYR